MSRTRYRISETEREYPYFMTCTIVGWLPVFTRPEAVDIVYDSWRYLQKNSGLTLFAYVILENHLHLLAKAPELGDTIGRFKSYTARQILDLLERRYAQSLLRQFERLKLRHKADSRHQFWQEGSEPKQVRTDETMWQKVEYIHMNPVKRGYVDDPVHWRYSSARNYAKMPGLIDVVTDWK